MNVRGPVRVFIETPVAKEKAMRLCRLVVTTTLVTLVGLAGCSDAGDEDAAAGVPTASPTASLRPPGWPTLITEPRGNGGGLDAIVTGVLGINEQGCVVLDRK